MKVIYIHLDKAVVRLRLDNSFQVFFIVCAERLSSWVSQLFALRWRGQASCQWSTFLWLTHSLSLSSLPLATISSLIFPTHSSAVALLCYPPLSVLSLLLATMMLVVTKFSLCSAWQQYVYLPFIILIYHFLNVGLTFLVYLPPFKYVSIFLSFIPYPS